MKIRIIVPASIAMGMGLASTAMAADLGPIAAPVSAPLATPIAAPSSLPQFETERIKGPQDVEVPKVGDSILFKIKGAYFPGIQESSEKHPDGKQESLEDQGWAILANKSVPSSSRGSEPAVTPSSAPGGIATTVEGSPELTVTAIPLKAGKIIFPSFDVLDSTGKVVGKSAPVAIEVESAISPSDPKPDQPEDVQPPAGLQFPFWIVILAGIFGLITFVLLGYSLYRGVKEAIRRRRKPEIPLTEDEAALLELAKLQELGLLEKGEFKRHYFRVSEILKTYVGGRYQFDAPESTTGEMLETLRNGKSVASGVGEMVISNLSFLFEKLDRVKFTDHIPETEESSQILGKAKEFIVNTRRPPLLLNSSGLNSSGVDHHAVK